MRLDFEELRAACKKHGLPDSTIYQNSLQWKLRRTRYHAKKSRAVWDKLDQIVSQKGSVAVGDREWQEVEFASAAEAEAAAQVVHSMGDTLAQILNLALLKPSLSEEEVYLGKVQDSLRSQSRYASIVSRVKELKACTYFQYIDAFVNTIKHRRLLDTDYHAEGGEGTRKDQSVRFLPFQYKGRAYPTTWANDITDSYIQAVTSRICDVGNSLNDYLR